jgi:hypothetical protein
MIRMTNDSHTALMLEELREMRRLLEAIAEPAIAKRDAQQRDALREIVGTGAKKQQSVMLMDGTRTRAEIIAETAVDKSDLSKLVRQLESAGLLGSGTKQPQLTIRIPPGFFDGTTTKRR